MDNLTAPKGERVREVIEGQGCGLLYLPPYSPDLDPIEEAFAKTRGKGAAAQGRGSQPRGIGGGDGYSDLRSQRTIHLAFSSIVVTAHGFDCYDQRRKSTWARGLQYVRTWDKKHWL